MIKEEFTLKSAYDGLDLSCAAYLPEEHAENAKGVVQLVHGMCEYKERYENFAEFLTDHGYIVFSHDHRGHGKSVKNEENGKSGKADNAQGGDGQRG